MLWQCGDDVTGQLMSNEITCSKVSTLDGSSEVSWKQRSCLVHCEGGIHRIVLRRTGYVSLPDHPLRGRCVEGHVGGPVLADARWRGGQLRAKPRRGRDHAYGNQSAQIHGGRRPEFR